MKLIVIITVLCLCSWGVSAATLNAGDINQDLHVDLQDFVLLAQDWQTNAARSDILPDGIVDVLDLMQLGEDWLTSQNHNNPQVTLTIAGAVSGEIVIELYGELAPVTVENFLNYVQSGFYGGLIFHRVMSGFMVQGGGFDTELVPKPTDLPIVSESWNGLSNFRGTIAMARTPAPHSATSQFFINHVDNIPGTDNTNLDYGALGYNGEEPYIKVGYCVFGRVISGMNIVDAIAEVPTTNTVPDEDVIIQSAAVTGNAPFCAEKMAGDVDENCRVDLADFAKMAQNWMMCNSLTEACQ